MAVTIEQVFPVEEKQRDLKRYFQFLLLLLAAGAIYPLLYLRQNFETPILDAFQITSSDLGNYYSMLGLMYFLCYLPRVLGNLFVLGLFAGRAWNWGPHRRFHHRGQIMDASYRGHRRWLSGRQVWQGEHSGALPGRCYIGLGRHDRIPTVEHDPFYPSTLHVMKALRSTNSISVISR